MKEIYRAKDPFVFTIFGASGDLAQLKIFPALFALAEQKRLPKDYYYVGYSRTEMSHEEFRAKFEASVRKYYKGTWGEYQEEILKDCLTHVYYFSGQYTEAESYKAYRAFRDEITEGKKVIQLYYFSVPPSVFAPIVREVAGIRTQGEDVRLIVEKPFGEDEKSARKLFHEIVQYFDEDDIYLLDHYLGKKPVQSILAMRHANRILNMMLRGKEIANIQISALETVGVGKRIGYFDESGTIKDMVQSHLLQLLALMTMSIPIQKNAANIQKEKAAILEALNFHPGENSLSLGQYEGYRDESEKVKNSTTPTFAALKLYINREAWYEVPIFLRTGKCLDERHTFMVVELKKFPFQPKEHQPNRIVIEFAPKEQISITLLDEDGVTSQPSQIISTHSIACEGDYCLPEHGLLLLDTLRGDKKFFLSFEEILACWQLVDEVEEFIVTADVPLDIYPVGSKGPESQHRLTQHKEVEWHDPHN